MAEERYRLRGASGLVGRPRGLLGQFTDEPVGCLTLLAAWPVAGDVGSVLRNVVTPSKKLFLAALLVSGGYGTAALLGAPDPRRWPESLAQGVPAHVRAALSADGSTNPNRVGSVRLLPESLAASQDRIHTAAAVAVPAPKPTAPSLMTGATSNTGPTTAPTTLPTAPLLTARPFPRASLKNEAPRPLPEADRAAQPFPQQQIDATSYAQPLPTEKVNAGPPVWSAGFAPTPIPMTGTVRASNEMSPQPPPELVLNTPGNSPSWTIPTKENDLLRTHIIVDGDSLAKLAGRYLDDPRRSEEIFTLNRGVLSDPELLPIGTELKIPPRAAGAASAYGPQSQVMGPTTYHAAGHTGVAPPRALPPISSGPRAQLLPPKPVD